MTWLCAAVAPAGLFAIAVSVAIPHLRLRIDPGPSAYGDIVVRNGRWSPLELTGVTSDGRQLLGARYLLEPGQCVTIVRDRTDDLSTVTWSDGIAAEQVGSRHLAGIPVASLTIDAAPGAVTLVSGDVCPYPYESPSERDSSHKFR